MATFNAELANKALERRIGGLEKTVEAMEKSARAAGDQTRQVTDLQKQLADLGKRVDELDKLVKTLMDTRGDSKDVAMQKLQATVETMMQQRLKETAGLAAEREKERKALEQKLLGGVTAAIESKRADASDWLQKFNAQNSRWINEQDKKLREELARLSGIEKDLKAAVDARVKEVALLAQEAAEKKAHAEDAKRAKELQELVKTEVERAQKLAVDTQLKTIWTELASLKAMATRR